MCTKIERVCGGEVKLFLLALPPPIRKKTNLTHSCSKNESLFY